MVNHAWAVWSTFICGCGGGSMSGTCKELAAGSVTCHRPNGRFAASPLRPRPRPRVEDLGLAVPERQCSRRRQLGAFLGQPHQLIGALEFLLHLDAGAHHGG